MVVDRTALRRVAAVVVAGAVLVGCARTDEPRPFTDSAQGATTNPTTSLGQATTAGATATATAATEPTSTDPAAVSGDNTAALALRAVPREATSIAFTDVAAVKDRLGYGDITSESLTTDKIAFWEAALADGSMLTGYRFYQQASLLSIDYGWGPEDIDWEVDFRTGAGTSPPLQGYVVKLRNSLDWSVVTQSLTDNGFAPVAGDPTVLATTDDDAPFRQVRLIPELRALAVGDDPTLAAVSDVVGGAPSEADELAVAVARLGPVESLLSSGGCVPLQWALGPDVDQDDLDAFFKANDPSGLGTATQVVTGIVDDDEARAVLVFDGAIPAADAAERTAITNEWVSLQTGLAFSDIGSSTVDVDGSTETVTIDVAAMDPFVQMLYSDDTPWALCPATAPPR